jgi:uncharacterized protein (TIGR00369 family)
MIHIDKFKHIKIEEWNEELFFKWAGIEIMEVAEGYAKMCINIEPHHRGGGGTKAINGGIVAYLFDGLLGLCTATQWDENTIGMATISLNVNYVGMLHAEKIVVGEAKVIKRGRGTVFLEANVKDDTGNLAATCTGIYKLRQKK